MTSATVSKGVETRDHRCQAVNDHVGQIAELLETIVDHNAARPGSLSDGAMAVQSNPILYFRHKPIEHKNTQNTKKSKK